MRTHTHVQLRGCIKSRLVGLRGCYLPLTPYWCSLNFSFLPLCGGERAAPGDGLDLHRWFSVTAPVRGSGGPQLILHVRLGRSCSSKVPQKSSVNPPQNRVWFLKLRKVVNRRLIRLFSWDLCRGFFLENFICRKFQRQRQVLSNTPLYRFFKHANCPFYSYFYCLITYVSAF